MTSIRLFLLFLLLTVTPGCNNPAGFWNNFNSPYIKNNLSDQGPYGGHRAIYWDIENTSNLNAEDFIEFARQNGWTLIDSTEYDSTQTSQWTYDKQQIFPISNFVFDDAKKGISIHKYFPRWFDGRMKLYRFKTRWITIEPETGSSFEENGFVLVNDKKNKIAVYHWWGNNSVTNTLKT